MTLKSGMSIWIRRGVDEILNRIIAVDFDGTLCENEFPEIGATRTTVIDSLLMEQRFGAKLILWTCRTGDRLEEAVQWCLKRGIQFDAVNENLPDVIEQFGGDTRKIVATEYWDDRSINMNAMRYTFDTGIALAEDVQRSLKIMERSIITSIMPDVCYENDVSAGAPDALERILIQEISIADDSSTSLLRAHNARKVIAFYLRSFSSEFISTVIGCIDDWIALYPKDSRREVYQEILRMCKSEWRYRYHESK